MADKEEEKKKETDKDVITRWVHLTTAPLVQCQATAEHRIIYINLRGKNPNCWKDPKLREQARELERQDTARGVFWNYDPTEVFVDEDDQKQR